MKIVVGGPPRSGKSVLLKAIRQAIGAIPGAPYCYVVTACPDGEGSWYQETVHKTPELAAELKAAHKSKFTWEFAETAALWVQNCHLPLTLVDLGGIVDGKNELIARHASHAILLASREEDFEVWREFCTKLSLRLIAELVSDHHSAEDHVSGVGADGVLRGVIHHLERGEDASDRPVVVSLARYILDQVSNQGPTPGGLDTEAS
ncbi:MAG: hypothetical protein JNL98_37170 [Bryobacterales bacterium]|nr:hypothetical protein [Bryobacterales bacterium]